MVLHELLTGSRPYSLDGLGPEQIVRTVCETDAPPPSRVLARRGQYDTELARLAAERRTQPGALARRLRGDLDNIVLKALHKEPPGRYASAAELAQDIGRYLSGEPVSAQGASLVYRLAKFARRRRSALLLGVALLTTLTAVGLYVHAVTDAERRVQALIARHASPPDPLPSIAILPFHETGGSADHSLLGNGMANELTAQLSRLSALHVAAYNSVLRYRDTPLDYAVIGRELGVRYVVSGIVALSDPRLRVEATLVDTHAGRSHWSVQYDTSLEGIFNIQAALSAKIVTALGLTLSAEEQKTLGQAETRSVNAYLAFLQGLVYYAQRWRAPNLEARRHFEKALAFDPGFARAYATLANTYRAEFANGWSADPASSLARAETLVQRALALDDTIPQVHFVMGLVRREQRRHTEALAAAARAVALNPNYADGFVLMASVLCYDGKTENTIGLIEKAVRLNPHYPLNYTFHFGQCYFAMGRYAEAAATFEQALGRNPVAHRELLWLIASYVHAGRLEDAQWKVEELLVGNPEISVSRLSSTIPFTRRELLDHFLDGLRRAGMPE